MLFRKSILWNKDTIQKVFKKSVGLNGVGTKAVNALSHLFRIPIYKE